MFVRILLGLLGLFHLANGLYMLAAPDSWYAAIPGVAMTGPINHHFIADVGLAFVASGVGLTLGLRAGKMAATFALAGATWPALHAFLHLWGWVEHSIPTNTNVLISEAIGVIALSALGAVLAWINARKEGII